MIEVRLNQLVLIQGKEGQLLRLEEAQPNGDRPRRLLTLVIGRHEAEEIGRCLRATATPRPLTHQLAASLVEALGGKLVGAVINDLRDGTFYARLTLESPNGRVQVDCRPSDAIALSLRCASPIHVAEQVMAEAGAEQA